MHILYLKLISSIFIIFTMCFAFSIISTAQQNNPPPITPGKLYKLLDRLSEQTEKYKDTFKDMIAKETRTFEVYSPDGKLKESNRLIADLIVYTSQKNQESSVEFRNILEVNGKPLRKNNERLEKLFERLKKDDSSDKEMSRIRNESTRYDLGYRLSGYMFFKAIATWKIARPLFKYEWGGQEKIDNRELFVINFEQKEFRKNMFGLDQVFDPNLFTGPMMRGTYWVDVDRNEIRREHHEIFFRNNATSETYKIVEIDYDFEPSNFGVFLPRRIVLQHHSKLKAKKGEAVQMYRSGKSVSELTNFQRFNTEGKQEYPQNPK